MKGTVTFVGMEEGITIKLPTDELTGLTNIEVWIRKIVRLPQRHSPAVKMVDADGKDLLLPVLTYRLSTSCQQTPGRCSGCRQWAW